VAVSALNDEFGRLKVRQHALAGRGIEHPESDAFLHGDREAGRFLEFSLDALHQCAHGQPSSGHVLSRVERS
jgi:hypothetical protein